MAFIDGHKDRFGVEPICRVLTEYGVAIAPSTYYAARHRPPSARAVRDADLLAVIRRVHADRRQGRGLYGSRKMWHQLRREGINVARCTVERPMRDAGLRGVRRGRPVVTTRPDPAAARPPDLVNRDFSASRPNELWLVDFTYVATWSGTVFTAFVSDAFSRRIVGWRTAPSMPTELPLDALEMALWTRARAGEDVGGVVHHSDAGSQGGFKWSSRHLDVEVSDGTTTGLGDDADRKGTDALAGPAGGQSTGGQAGVLEAHSRGAVERGRCVGVRRVAAGGYAVVS